MSNQNRNQSESNDDTRSKLGFKVGDSVTISNHFFYNHNLTPIYFGEGVVRAKITPTKTTLPALIIEIPLHRAMLDSPDLRKLIIPAEQHNKGVVWMKIHPLYLELSKKVKNDKKKSGVSNK